MTAAAAALAADPLLACAVCYGKAGDPMIDGARLSILFMVGLTYGLLLGGVALVVVVRTKKAKRGDT
ncbi:MAG TPA: hypothetical protein VMT16_03380 [Thermoanaerobaculia bacterium]|nr:hypothetical protein [Thermoanaerobaculia bacterium]